jgi:hypothetical protein
VRRNSLRGFGLNPQQGEGEDSKRSSALHSRRASFGDAADGAMLGGARSDDSSEGHAAEHGRSASRVLSAEEAAAVSARERQEMREAETRARQLVSQEESMQELLVMMNGSAASKPQRFYAPVSPISGRPVSATLCMLCRNDHRSQVFVPCSHVACCAACARITKVCPICSHAVDDCQQLRLW